MVEGGRRWLKVVEGVEGVEGVELLSSLTAERLVTAKDPQYCHKRSRQSCRKSSLKVSNVSKLSI